MYISETYKDLEINLYNLTLEEKLYEGVDLSQEVYVLNVRKFNKITLIPILRSEIDECFDKVRTFSEERDEFEICCLLRNLKNRFKNDN